MFGSLGNYIYLCNVKMNVLAIRVESRVGAGPYRHRPVLKSCFGGSLFIIPFYKGLEKGVVWPTDSSRRFMTEAFPWIVFKSYILYTPLFSKIKSAVRMPLGLGRIYTLLPWATAFRAASNREGMSSLWLPSAAKMSFSFSTGLKIYSPVSIFSWRTKSAPLSMCRRASYRAISYSGMSFYFR